MTGAGSSSGGDPEGPKCVPPTTIKSTGPFDDLQHLIEFVETYLGKSLDLFSDYAKACLTHITFENLWMLFDIGEGIYCPLKKGGQTSKSCVIGLRVFASFTTKQWLTLAHLQQLESAIRDRELYHCGWSKTPGLPSIGVFGETPSQCYPESADQSSGLGIKYSQLQVIGLYMDHEAGKVLICNDVFVFTPFDGDVEITSLEIYPLRYKRHPADSCGGDLVERGLRFVDLILTLHRRYDGFTVSSKAGVLHMAAQPEVRRRA